MVKTGEEITECRERTRETGGIRKYRRGEKGTVKMKRSRTGTCSETAEDRREERREGGHEKTWMLRVQ